MAGQLIPLDGLPGRFATVAFDGERGVIMVRVDDAEGDVKASMVWGYSEPVEIPDPPADEPATDETAIEE